MLFSFGSVTVVVWLTQGLW